MTGSGETVGSNLTFVSRSETLSPDQFTLGSTGYAAFETKSGDYGYLTLSLSHDASGYDVDLISYLVA